MCTMTCMDTLRTPPLPRALPQKDSLGHLIPEARSQTTGRLDARQLAAVYGLTLRDMVVIIGRDASGLARRSDSAGVQEALQPLEELAVKLRAYFGSMETGRMWLQAPNPALGGGTPISRLRDGKIKTVQKLLQMAQTGTPV